jgi:hypothetical protein
MYKYKPIYEKVVVVRSKASLKNDAVDVTDKLDITYELAQIL